MSSNEFDEFDHVLDGGSDVGEEHNPTIERQDSGHSCNCEEDAESLQDGAEISDAVEEDVEEMSRRAEERKTLNENEGENHNGGGGEFDEFADVHVPSPVSSRKTGRKTKRKGFFKPKYHQLDDSDDDINNESCGNSGESNGAPGTGNESGAGGGAVEETGGAVGDSRTSLTSIDDTLPDIVSQMDDFDTILMVGVVVVFFWLSLVSLSWDLCQAHCKLLFPHNIRLSLTFLPSTWHHSYSESTRLTLSSVEIPPSKILSTRVRVQQALHVSS